jgi:hypothetical protein
MQSDRLVSNLSGELARQQASNIALHTRVSFKPNFEAFPVSPSDVTTEWLSCQLGVGVASFEMQKVGKGLTSDAHRVTYTHGEDNTSTVILKLPSAVGIDKQKSHISECTIEVIFYSEFCLHLQNTVLIPKCYGCCRSHNQPWKWNILLQDLSDIDGIEEFPTALFLGNVAVPDIVEITKLALCDLAKLHGRFWESALLDEHPIFDVQPSMYPGCRVNSGLISMGRILHHQNYRETGIPGNKVFTQRVRECQDIFPSHQFPFFSHGSQFMSFFDKLHLGKDVADYVYAHLNQRPMTLVHGDGHLGNLFYNRTRKEITWLDWQMLGRAPPAIELLQPLSSIDGEHQIPLAKAYYQALLRHGPAGRLTIAHTYSFDDMWQDYRYAWYLVLCTWASTYMPDMITAMKDDKEYRDMIAISYGRMGGPGGLWEVINIWDVEEEIRARIQDKAKEQGGDGLA